MSVISLKNLLDVGVHFGHKTTTWNPNLAPYIYTQKKRLYIIDLQQPPK